MSDTKEAKEYTNGEVTVVWDASKCIHAGLCAGNLPGVFNPEKRPWINMDGASTAAIAQQVSQCPSGALTHYQNKS